MATITPVLIGRAHNKAIFKWVGNTAGDTGTVAISTAITINTPGSITFNAADATITRTTGNWTTDGVTVGSVLVISSTVSNNGTFIVKNIKSATQLTIETNTSSARNYLVDEVDAAVTFTGSYKSDLLAYGQIIVGTPKINIARARYSVSSAGDVSVTRNGTLILKLFGHDEIECPTNEQNTQAIVATFNTSAGGTLILELTKVDGFSAVNPSSTPY